MVMSIVSEWPLKEKVRGSLVNIELYTCLEKVAWIFEIFFVSWASYDIGCLQAHILISGMNAVRIFSQGSLGRIALKLVQWKSPIFFV